tara:strand:- start:52 stop:951 length:900 start_codon:yes stop_codon:yes gene_type:complete
MSDNTASIIKSLVSLAIIGIIIYIIVAFHTVFGQILHDVEQLGHTVFQAIGISLEKLDCCINGCPGNKTPCSASQIKSMKDNSGYNICSNCKPTPCKLKSYDSGISCTEWAFLGLFGLLGWLLTQIKRANTKDVLDDAKKAAVEASDTDPLDIVDIGKKDNILDEDDFDFFDIDKSNEDAKAEIRKFTKVDPSTLKEGDIPKSVKDKFKLEGDPLLKRCKTRITTRENAHKSLVNHEISTNMQKLNPDNKTLNDQLKKEVQSIEDQWKSDKPTDKDKKPNENEEKDYNDSVEKDFHPEV